MRFKKDDVMCKKIKLPFNCNVCAINVFNDVASVIMQCSGTECSGFIFKMNCAGSGRHISNSTTKDSCHISKSGAHVFLDHRKKGGKCRKKG